MGRILPELGRYIAGHYLRICMVNAISYKITYYAQNVDLVGGVIVSDYCVVNST